jgi:hypothetical protein
MVARREVSMARHPEPTIVAKWTHDPDWDSDEWRRLWRRLLRVPDPKPKTDDKPKAA